MALPSDPAAIVIRGSISRDAQMLCDELIYERDHGRPMCLSVFALDPKPGSGDRENLEAVCRASGAPWGQLRVSTVERLAASGFKLADERNQREAACHYQVHFPRDVTVLETQRFLDAFDIVDNPVPKPERGKQS